MSQRAIGLLLLLLTAINWGATWPVLKILLTEMPPLTMRAMGTALVAVILMVGARIFRISLFVPHAQRGRLVVFGLLNVTAWMAFGTIALRWLSASEGAILAYTMPVWAALFAWPILGEKPTLRRVIGLALGFGSVAVLFAGRGAAVGLEKLPGMLLILTSAFLFALGAVLSKKQPLVLHPITALAWQMAIGCLPMAIMAPLTESFTPAQVSTQVWVVFFCFMIFCMAVSYLTWFGALARLPASTATLGTLLAPVLSVIAAAVILGDPLGAREWIALGGVVAAVALAVASRDKRP